MAWLAVDKDGSEYVYPEEPTRRSVFWEYCSYDGLFLECIELPRGSIKKLIGKELTWSNEPVELK